MTRYLAPLAVAVLLTVSACAAAPTSTDVASLESEVSAIREQGAAMCAPKEFAGAEAHLHFAQDAFKARRYNAAADHLRIAREQTDRARQFIDLCRPATGHAAPTPSGLTPNPVAP
ncbi:MAG: DUF4398 domain-containing protein [Deltaproteobacteria bacterium]|nr:DUF4398 domain-containing protein [Deltaproteobacteria bacterium]MCB9479565.1 DUF4398 domain-containing protein [Deltaproteobacteria bacterium]